MKTDIRAALHSLSTLFQASYYYSNRNSLYDHGYSLEPIIDPLNKVCRVSIPQEKNRGQSSNEKHFSQPKRY
ncbi:hypothetical protein [Vibrio breoganii]|uniref:hypothetical protein n=1 Tax=Vibrio breoganii TaxID=553239 RepID=UPI0010562270|nr:hypothetical protein [Vibrio breoganii]MDN3715248.1 hypothetical protein [Vibrio breoganii]